MAGDADFIERWPAPSVVDLGIAIEPELGEDPLDPVHEWRAEQLERLGIPALSAQIFADLVDWHGIAALVRRGCPPILALKIVAILALKIVA